MRGAMLILVLLLAGGCAVVEEGNRPTLNALDEVIAPESTAARIALAPLVMPLGLGALALDQLIVHPALVVDDAWDDTVDVLWTPEADESAFKRGLLLPVMVVATPIVFLGDWLVRAAFPLEDR